MPRPFMDFLREHRSGSTHDELSDALNALVAAVTEEGKAGKLTLTIAIKPAGRDSGALEVAAEMREVLNDVVAKIERGANVSVIEGIAPSPLG